MPEKSFPDDRAECLRRCPALLEAVDALVDLRAPRAEIRALVQQQPAWLGQYVDARVAFSCHDYHAALAGFSELLMSIFPENPQLLLGMARAHGALNHTSEALRYYRRVRALDPSGVADMDEFAVLLRREGEPGELSRLTVELMRSAPGRPESWAAASVYWDVFGDKSRAMLSAERGLRLNERHVTCHLLKGHLCLNTKRVENAIIAFRAAKNLRPDLSSYHGLVRAYLAGKRYKEALFTAKEAVKEMPQNARALTLLGDAHSQHAPTRRKARQIYERALRVDATCTEAVLSLSELDLVMERFDDAVKLLKRHLSQSPSDAVYVKLGSVMSQMARLSSEDSTLLGEALKYYQEALNMNAQCDEARRGVARIVKLMKGMDPDATDEDPEPELEDGEEMDDPDHDDIDGNEIDAAMDMDAEARQWP